MPPAELPGFYYDPQKNRYFPIRGPIPGSSRKSAPFPKPVPEITQVNPNSRKGRKLNKLLHCRELCGNTISLRKWHGSFQKEYTNYQASQPVVFKYKGTERDSDVALGIKRVTIQTPVGEVDTDLMLTGGSKASLSLFEVGRVGQMFDYGVNWTADQIFPKSIEGQAGYMPNNIWKLNGALLELSSNISSISNPRKEMWPVGDHAPTSQHALITTLGSGSSGGQICTFNLSAPLDLDPSFPAVANLRVVASTDLTIWAGDCSSITSKSVIGTNTGAMLVDLETGDMSTLCISKSDALSVQFSHSGSVVLCGLRNGLIVTIDLRQSQPCLPTHHIPIPTKNCTGSSTVNATRNRRFLLRGNIRPSDTVCMTSSISCLAALSLHDQYFMASSMDGSVKLYDHRLTQRGPVQSYEGLVNTHTRIQLGVDPYERFVISGGEDSKVRVWNIKSGEMLFEDKFTDSIPISVCCQGNGSSSPSSISKRSSEYSWGAWLGAPEGLLWMQFP